MGRALVCLETVDSQQRGHAAALAGAADGLAVVAEQQTGGRGRRGRSFVSPAGQGLYLSVLLRPRCPLEEVSTLTAWTAVAVCTAVERVCGVRPGIEWPNDVILDGRKLCGILTELELEAETAALRHVVVGVGINLTQTAADFGPRWPRWLSPGPGSGTGPPPGGDGGGRASRPGRAVRRLPGRAGGLAGAVPGRLSHPAGRGESASARAGEEEEAFAEAVDDAFRPGGAPRRRQPGGGVLGEVSVRGLLGMCGFKSADVPRFCLTNPTVPL